jgi:hypothetical protein
MMSNTQQVTKKQPETSTTTRAPSPESTLPEDIAKLLDKINGQDTYNASEFAISKLSHVHYLKLPNTFQPTPVDSDHIGTVGCVSNLTDEIWEQIYCLNKDVFRDSAHGNDKKDVNDEVQQIKGALLRAELVAAGWVDVDNDTSTSSNPYKEISHVTPLEPSKVNEIMTRDKATIDKYIRDAKKLAFLLPLATEYLFRTTGYVYQPRDPLIAAEYDQKYQRIFSACAMPELTHYLPPKVLYHQTAHWVSHAKALAVAKSNVQKTTHHLPNAIVIRADHGPSGTAVITASAAVLKAMKLSTDGQKDALVTMIQEGETSVGNIADMITSIERMSCIVKTGPGRYHTVPLAYNERELTAGEKKEFQSAKDNAIQLAPLFQGFLDALPRGSPHYYNSSRALMKHAGANPFLRKRAKIFFKDKI